MRSSPSSARSLRNVLNCGKRVSASPPAPFGIEDVGKLTMAKRGAKPSGSAPRSQRRHLHVIGRHELTILVKRCTDSQYAVDLDHVYAGNWKVGSVLDFETTRTLQLSTVGRTAVQLSASARAEAGCIQSVWRTSRESLTGFSMQASRPIAPW